MYNGNMSPVTSIPYFRLLGICLSRICRICIPLFLCIVVTAGCSRTETADPEEQKKADRTLLIGLIPERNIFEQMERYEPLAEYLSEKIGMKVGLKVLTRYGNIIENFVSLNLDGAFLGSFTYTLAHAKLGVVPIARPVNIDGTSTYHGLIFVRKDSGIQTSEDMKGKVFAFVDRATTAGYLLPIAYFRENGIKDHRTYFKEVYFTGTHDAAIYDVLNKRADIGAAKNTIYYSLAEKDKRIADELSIITRSPDVPENGLAVKKDLDISVRNKLKEVLLHMHDNPEGRKVLMRFRAKRFIDTGDDDYAAVYKYVKEIKLDLATYDYLND